MDAWKTLSSKEVYKTPWIRVRRDEVINHAGKQLTYSVVELNHPSVFIVATNAKGHILLEHNYRYTTNKLSWEVPAGHSDGKALLEAAKLELLEETGFSSDDWTYLGRMNAINGIGNVPFDTFLARNVQRVTKPSDELEAITKLEFMSLKDIENLVREGKFLDSTSLAAIYQAKIHGL